MLYFHVEGAKYHKKELVYLTCSDQQWIADELRNRKRPSHDANVQLSEVLRRSEAFERGDGLLPVRTITVQTLSPTIKHNFVEFFF